MNQTSQTKRGISCRKHDIAPFAKRVGVSQARLRAASASLGFTLIELLTVIAIIGILAALLFPAIKSSLTKAEIAKAQTEIKGIETAWKVYFNEYGKWPRTDAGYILAAQSPNESSAPAGIPFDHAFVSLMQGRTIDDLPYHYLDDNPKGITLLQVSSKSIQGGNYDDPWNRPFRMLFDIDYDNIVTTGGTMGSITNNVIVWSYGPDGLPNTKDDVTSW